MIPHHHHNNQGGTFSSLKIEEVMKYHHHHDGHTHIHETKSQESETSDNEEHEHEFPEHYHISGADDYVRMNIVERTFEIKDISTFLPIHNIQKELYKPPERGLKRFIRFSIDIKSSYQPGAIALRAPPCFA